MKDYTNMTNAEIEDECTKYDILVDAMRSAVGRVYLYEFATKCKMTWPKPEVVSVVTNKHGKSSSKIIRYETLISVTVENFKQGIENLKAWQDTSVSNAMNLRVSRTIDKLQSFVDEYQRNMEWISNNWRSEEGGNDVEET